MSRYQYIIPVLFLLLSACGTGAGSSEPVTTPRNMTGGLVGVWNPVGEPKGKIILHQGHDTFDGSHDPAGNLIPVAEKLAAAGYVVYGMEMPPMPHAGRPLSDFTDPVTKLLDAIGPAYMVGLSGGGWTTTLVTATDARIIKGFSVAGDAPFDVWSNPPDKPIEPEQLLVDYRALYAAAGDRLLHIYNFVDSCCYSGIQGDTGYPYVTAYDNDGRHRISDWAVEYILANIAMRP